MGNARRRKKKKATNLLDAASANELVSELSSDLLDLIALVGNQV